MATSARPSKAAPRRPAPSASARAASTRRARSNTRLAYDLCGIGLVAAGLILLATLAFPPSRTGENVFGAFVIAGLRLMVGAGAWAFPLVLLVCGVLLAVGRSRSWDNIGAAVVAFLLFISWWHLGHVPIAGHFAKDNLLGFGGYVGAALSWCLRAAVGTIGAHILFAALATVALLFLTDVPLPVVLGPFERLVSAGAQASGRAMKTGAQTAASRVAERRAMRREWAEQDEKEDDDTTPVRQTAAARRRTNAPRLFERGIQKGEEAQTEPDEAEPTIVTNRTSDAGAEPPTVQPGAGRPGLFTLHSVRKAGEPKNKATAPASAKETVTADETPPEPARLDMGAASATPEIPGMEDYDPSVPLAQSGRGVNKNAPTLDAAKKFVLPPLSLLRTAPPVPKDTGESSERRGKLLQTLEDFGIGADVVDVASGPTITRYEIALERGIKVSKIVSLADNLAMALAAIDVRVEAPIPGKAAIGIEVPNEQPQVVPLREVIERPEFQAASKTSFALGKDVTGQCRYADLAKMPHLLIGGSTGAGKSAGLNALICSLLYRNTPRELKLLMIDPKKVELSLYDGIPHLAAPVITNVKQAPGIFKQALKEMESRYDRFAKMGTRNIEGFNGRVNEDEKLPYWVIIVDELADLMMQSGPEIETAICRLAQLARATGIHLVIATQRPSVNVITGTIKANISSRIAFAVNSAVDSRTILDQTGADRLIGRGDMLFSPMDAAKPMRIQGCWVSEQETEALVAYLKQQAQPNYEVLPSALSAATGEDESGEAEADDELFESAVNLVVTGGSASTSMLQRRFKIGYTRAARLVDLMEQRGIVGALDGAKPREILLTRDEVMAMFTKGDRVE